MTGRPPKVVVGEADLQAPVQPPTRIDAHFALGSVEAGIHGFKAASWSVFEAPAAQTLPELRT